jgi:hypothetical protein
VAETMAVLSVAPGVGVNSALFSFYDAIMWHPANHREVKTTSNRHV